MKSKVNFICVGTQKAGTTTLHDILKTHYDIFLPEKKEAIFFSDESRYKRGLNWWKKEFFSKYNGEKSVGVFTPDYLYYDEVPKRILNDLGSEIKIIIILRNPVERAYSHYLMTKRRGYEKLSFNEGIENENIRINESSFNRNHFSYLSRGMYYNQLKKYHSLFDSNNILILNFEKDIVKNIDATIKKIQKFIGVELIDLNVNHKSNVAKEARNKLLNSLLNSNGFMKIFFKSFVRSKELRLLIRKSLIKFNRVPNNNKLTYSQKKYMTDKYFINDILKVEKSYKLNLKHWLR